MDTIMTPEQMLTMTAQLEVAAAEIRNAGHPGWGNICADAADLIRQMVESPAPQPAPLKNKQVR